MDITFQMPQSANDISELDRLNQLHLYNILDSDTEKDYEDITYLASIICDVPIALISFVDKDRDWFKSSRGWNMAEIRREHSFCHHALHSTDPLIIPDSRMDERFKDNPYVTGDPHFVFYAGIPLQTENGHGLGTICVLDNKPRVLREDQVNALKILSRQVSHLLDMRILNTELKDIRQNLETENKKLQEEGLQLGLSMEKSIAGQVKAIALMNNELKKMHKELEAFTYISSHHLQEPLRKIQTFISIIADREFKNLSEQGRGYLGKVTTSSDKIRSLIQDLHIYSSINLGSKKVKEVSLTSIIDEIKKELNEEITNNEAQIEVHEYCTLKVIPIQFRRLLVSLISNSLKFSRDDAVTRLTISCELKAGSCYGLKKLNPEQSYYQIKVTDNGQGFNNKYREKIFDIFQQLNTTDLRIGTGIGLAIAKRIVENHNGIITAESIENILTTFTIYIPNV